MSKKSSKHSSELKSQKSIGIKSSISSTLVTDVAEIEEKENLEPQEGGPKLAPKVKPSSCVFVASLRSTRSDDDLCRSVTTHFSQFGSLLSVKVLRDPSDRPYAFVQYSNDEDSKTAIDLGHNSTLDGRRLRCEAAKVNRTLFVAGFKALTLKEIESEMQKYGEVELIVAATEKGQLVTEQLTPRSSSENWFVKFSYRDDAIRAFASITDNPEYHVEWAQNIDDLDVNVPKIDKFSIFIGLLFPEVTEKDIRERFGAYGEISEVQIKVKPISTFAFITYKLELSAASAVATENHAMFMDKTIHVQYKEVTARSITRVILSPRTPVALAPPPINVRRKYTSRDLKSFFENGPQDSYAPRGYAAQARYTYGTNPQSTYLTNRAHYNYKARPAAVNARGQDVYRPPVGRQEPVRKVLGARENTSWASSVKTGKTAYNKRLSEVKVPYGVRRNPYALPLDEEY